MGDNFLRRLKVHKLLGFILGINSALNFIFQILNVLLFNGVAFYFLTLFFELIDLCILILSGLVHFHLERVFLPLKILVVYIVRNNGIENAISTNIRTFGLSFKQSSD